MNLAGNRAKHLFRSLRTGGSPPIIGLWTAATAVDQIRKRSTRPAKELIVRKQLKPGQSYLIRVPGKGEAPLAGSLPAGTQVAEVDPPGEEPSIATQLLDAATDLLAAGVEAKEEAGVAETPDRRRRRRKASETSDGPAAAKVSRRDSRLASLDDFETDRDALPSRLRRKLNRAEKRARKRPSRRRVRKARKQHKRAARASAGVEQPAQPSRRRRRRLRAATRNLEERRAKVDKRSTRRRRRKLRNAEKAYKKLE